MAGCVYIQFYLNYFIMLQNYTNTDANTDHSIWIAYNCMQDFCVGKQLARELTILSFPFFL